MEATHVDRDTGCPTQHGGADEDVLSPLPDGYDLVTAGPDEPFERVVGLAAQLFDVPFATVSVVAADRVRLRARHDLGLIGHEPGMSCWSQLVISALTHGGLYTVEDVATDPRCPVAPPGLRFYAAAPFTNSAGRPIGVVDIAGPQPRTLGAAEYDALRSLATIVEAELRLREVSARRAELERTFSTQRHRTGVLFRNLRESVLPRHPPQIPHLEVATMYLPAGGEQAAGDFFDVFAIADDRWAVTIADVVGRGVSAIAMAALLRWSLRTAARHHRDAGQILADANYELLLDQGDAIAPCCATAIVALVEPRPGRCRVTLARAGHPPALMATATGHLAPLPAQGPVLGASRDAVYQSVKVDLSAGDSLIVHTDGLFRGYAGAGMPGDAHPATLWSGTPGTNARWFVERARTALLDRGGAVADDAALVVARVRDSCPYTVPRQTVRRHRASDPQRHPRTCR